MRSRAAFGVSGTGWQRGGAGLGLRREAAIDDVGEMCQKSNEVGVLMKKIKGEEKMEKGWRV